MRLRLASVGRGAVPVLVCATAALFASCGGGDEREGDPAIVLPAPVNSRAAIADVVRTYFNALAAADGERACEVMTDSAKVQLAALGRGSSATTCAQVLEEASTAVDADARRELLNTNVTKIRINGDSATATAVDGRREVSLSLNEGKWQILVVDMTMPRR